MQTAYKTPAKPPSAYSSPTPPLGDSLEEAKAMARDVVARAAEKRSKSCQQVINKRQA
jgi:hypothetical protein